MNWELPFLVKKQHAFPWACQPVETISLQRKWFLILHWGIHVCHEWIWSWIWICLMRMKSNFILKNSLNRNFRVNAILTHWLSTFPTSVYNLSWTPGGRGSSRVKVFNMGIQSVPLVLSPVVFKWPLDCLGSECSTHRSLYEWNCKSHSCTYYTENSAEASCLPHPAQDWISPQPSYCVSSPIISIPGNEMFGISWKLTPWITSLHMNGKTCV